MNISAPFIRRPVATSLLTVALFFPVLWPIACSRSRLFPKSNIPTIQVAAGLPGASPDTMASAVATPLERMFGRIAGITQMTSSAAWAPPMITCSSIWTATSMRPRRDVQAAINAARGQLPANLPNNPAWRKINPAEQPIMVLSLTSDTATQQQMYDVADSILSQKISQVPASGRSASAAVPSRRCASN